MSNATKTARIDRLNASYEFADLDMEMAGACWDDVTQIEQYIPMAALIEASNDNGLA